MKILMVADYTYRIPSGNSSLHKGKIYETEGWEDGKYLIKVEDRPEPVIIPERLARIVWDVPKKEESIVAGMIHSASIPRPESEHYHTGNVDVWQFADENFHTDEVLGFHRINIIKYVTRYGKKNGYNRTDLEKARVMIDKLLELHDKHRS